MERGPILAIIATRFPAATNDSLDLPEGEYWAELSDCLEICPKCGGRCITLIRVRSFNPLTGVAIFCSPEKKLIRLVDLGHEQIMATQVIARAFFASCDPDSMEILSLSEARKRGLAARSTQASGSVTTNPIHLDPLIASVPVPDGYRNVAWLKSHEAKAISMAYERNATVPVKTTSGKDIFRAEYVATSRDADKLKANVKGVRIRTEKRDQELGWIREMEAQAVLDALANEESIERTDTDLNIGVLVQFFAKDSLEEKTFKSCTRLLRKL